MNKLQGKDLINVGIFTAIYFVVMMAIAMLGFIPIFLPLLIVLVPLIGGIVMMLYYSKVQKFGMVSLTGLICGILMLLTGMGYWGHQPAGGRGVIDGVQPFPSGPAQRPDERD